MSDNYTFPQNQVEALAMLYVQTQDLKDKTPTEVYNLYRDARDEIKQARSDRQSSEKKLELLIIPVQIN